MNPALSVVFLTTLIGVGQGLFLALFTGESYSTLQLLPAQSDSFYVLGSAIAVAFLIAGLLASFFHLGHPERAWRAATRWRTSWLSREVIVLPAVIGSVFVYGVLHYFGIETTLPVDLTLVVGAVGMLATFLLFICTGMIYACIKFLQEWASWLTIVNYTLLGTASGFTLAAAFSVYTAPDLVRFFATWAVIITITALITRSASLIRNARIKARSTIQTAIGVRHEKVVQKSQGFLGGSFNTREYFHGLSRVAMRNMKWLFIVMVFVIPAVLLLLGIREQAFTTLFAAFVVQYVGLLFERWFFFAQANHPQNIYYQHVG